MILSWQVSKSGPALTLAEGLIVIVISSKAGIQGPKPSGSLVVSLKDTVPPTSDGAGLYVAVTTSPVILLTERVPAPDNTLHDPAVALGSRLPVNGMDVGSQTTKSAGTATL